MDTTSKHRLDPMSLLKKADAFAGLEDWMRAKECADAAIEANPALAPAYTYRAWYLRRLGQFESALADYDRTIELDPQNSSAWLLRGWCRAEWAGTLANHATAMQVLREVHPDYHRAAELQPDSELTGLSLLELEICLGKYPEAVGTTGEWWDRIRQPSNKLICAWLGAIAMILAGRPERRWSHFRDHLQTDPSEIGLRTWCPTEIEYHIRHLENLADVVLTQVKAIHALFLSHFPVGSKWRTERV